MRPVIVGDWKITNWGLIHNTFPPYEIHKARLNEDWARHMEEKKWVILPIFKAALGIARSVHGGDK